MPTPIYVQNSLAYNSIGHALYFCSILVHTLRLGSCAVINNASGTSIPPLTTKDQ